MKFCETGGIPDVPDAELVVISNASKEGLVQQVPGDVFNHRCVPSEHALCIDYLNPEVYMYNFSKNISA